MREQGTVCASMHTGRKAGKSSVSSIDLELITALERVFARHAGDDQLIDAKDLQKALGLKSEYLARRVLRAFDADGSGSIDCREFVSAVRGLVFGTTREKLAFTFRMHDDDGDGFLSETEVLRMVSISLAESRGLEAGQAAEEGRASAGRGGGDTDARKAWRR